MKERISKVGETSLENRYFVDALSLAARGAQDRCFCAVKPRFQTAKQFSF